MLVSNARKFTNLAPVSNFYYITTTLVGWGYDGNLAYTKYLPTRVCFVAPTMYEHELVRESISAEDTLCFGAHRVWIRVRGGYVTFGWNYKPTPIKTYRNPADRLCAAGIGSSDFHLADFGFGRLLRLSPLRSNFAECTFTVPTQFESRLYSTNFFRAGSIFNWNYILYTSFFLHIYFQKHNTIYT